jgi:myo-inositol 2-dehydrogenase / D-chiro-inositol 1-dehydrogenase
VTDGRLRAAVIGAGAWGRQHARALTAHPGVRLTAIVGRTRARTEARAHEFGARPYVSIRDMLDRERPELVCLSLPNEGHFEATLEVIAHGVPLLVEKPLVFDLEEARTLVREAAARDLFFGINFNHRYAKPVQLAAAAVADGRLGSLVFATWRFGGERGSSTQPHANLIETQCHGFDMLEHLGGPIQSVAAQMTDDAGHGHETVAVALRFGNGAVGSLLGSYASSYAYPWAHLLELNGSGGRVVVEDTVRRFTFTPARSEHSEVWQAGYFDDDARAFHATLDRHLDAVVDALCAGGEPPVHARAGLRALEIAHAVIASHEQGSRVPVPAPSDNPNDRKESHP